jgi:hypothetical protein
MSARPSIASPPVAISGAMKPGVPLASPSIVS